MGVKGLHTYVERACPHERRALAALHELATPGSSRTIVVDGMALIRKLYPLSNDWVGGGEWQTLYRAVGDFVASWRLASLELVCFFDGGVDAAKLTEWVARRRRDLANIEKHVEQLARGVPPRATSSSWSPPMYVSKWLAAAFTAHGCRVIVTVGEADREIARYCRDEKCLAVLGKDSDFFVLPLTGLYLPVDTLQLAPARGLGVSTVCAYGRDDVLRALGVSEALLPLLASLVGNDFVDSLGLTPLHARLLQQGEEGAPSKAATGELISRVAREVSSACAATGWNGGCLITPLLWDALDLEEQISAATRAEIETSLRQYELGPPGQGHVSRGRAASAELCARYESGLLDSAIYSAVTCRAIWRGPSLEAPGEPPAILASRPIRAEVYASCVPPLPDGSITVREHLLYSSQSQPGAAEYVDNIPKPFVRAESAWKLPPDRQFELFARSLARASKSASAPPQQASVDALLCKLPAGPCIACAPLVLVASTVRFLGRGQRIGPFAATALLCQGLRVANADRLRQRLPRLDARARRAAECPPLAALQAASLFMRVSTDILMLNTVLGSPLRLNGAWQWYDGPTFHHMYVALGAGASIHAHLLEGDPSLIQLFENLKHVALGLETHLAPSPEAAQQAVSSGLAAMARLWTATPMESAPGSANDSSHTCL